MWWILVDLDYYPTYLLNTSARNTPAYLSFNSRDACLDMSIGYKSLHFDTSSKSYLTLEVKG